MTNIQEINAQINSAILNTIDKSIDNNWDVSKRTINSLGVDLYDNQIEIVEAINDMSIPYLAILQARGGGKTHAVAAGVCLVAIDNPDTPIGIFAPKWDQARRVTRVCYQILKRSELKDLVDWDTSTPGRIEFKNGSYIIGLSANEVTQVEGWHFALMVVDEAHKVSDIAWSQKLTPMMGSYKMNKIVKIGVSMYKGHFYKSCKSPLYKVLKRDWTECQRLLISGSIMVDGKEYSKFIMDQFPLAIKTMLFPDHPELHTAGEMDVTDAKTQYLLIWVDNVNNFLFEDDQKMLCGSHDVLPQGIYNETYFFGLDTAQGSLVGNRGTDYTVLAIWRRREDQMKERVAAFEWQGDPMDQMEEILSIVDPHEGLFKCHFGIVDYSNIGITAVGQFKQKKIPVEGVLFGSREPVTGRNYKNAMCRHFRDELRATRVKYPDAKILDENVIMRKGFNEWCILEEIQSLGLNNKIQAPTSKPEDADAYHDDHCMADVMAVFAASQFETRYGDKKVSSYKIPKMLVSGIPHIAGRSLHTQKSHPVFGK